MTCCHWLCIVLSECRTFTSLEEIMQHFVRLTSGDLFLLSVQRGEVLNSALVGINRIAFSPDKPLKVCFPIVLVRCIGTFKAIAGGGVRGRGRGE